jgi:hypothetical protein
MVGDDDALARRQPFQALYRQWHADQREERSGHGARDGASPADAWNHEDQNQGAQAKGQEDRNGIDSIEQP